VVLTPAANPRAVAASAGASPHFEYSAALNGFAATLNPAQVDALSRNPNVEYIEADQVVTADFTQTMNAQGQPWGLDRIDQRTRPLSLSYTYNTTGTGVTVYVIDTGLTYTHTQFGGRASFGFDALGGSGSDCNGHGTHVGGTIGGSTYGVAKAVGLVAVRVLGCNGSGTTSGVIAGVNWVAQHHAALAVANMSLGGGASTALDQAVTNSINAGVTYAVAAGNNNTNACNQSPARTPAALTVAATDNQDRRASFSNFGTCVDIFAPGVSILSSYNTSNTATATLSGTSMASPHVAGVAALYKQLNPGATPAAIASALISNATSGLVQLPGVGTPNRLLHGLLGGSPPPTQQIAIASGTIRATVGTTLPQPLVARVTDGSGNPLSGVLVTFTVTAGGGSVSPTSATTNSWAMPARS
jgi:subtilisin family serine protease